jgi:signal peptidase
VLDTLAWSIAILALYFILRQEKTAIAKGNREIAITAIMIAAAQILVPTFTAFFVGFARNGITWDMSTLPVYFPCLFAGFLALELSRVTLAQTSNRRKPTSTLLLTSMLCAVVSIPSYTGLVSPAALLKFLLETFMPTIAVSMLATCFAFYGGLRASFTYMAIPAFFAWFSPILPNPPWAIQSLITVALSTVGFILLDQTANQRTIRHFSRIGMKQSTILSWIGILLLGTILVWGSSGMLGVKPTIVASGSMQPTLKQGDLAILVPVVPTSIKVGEIVQYETTNMTIIHRVIDTFTSGGSMWIVTKGDANSVPDDPVNSGQVTGKVLFTIPQLGWVSIGLRTFTAMVLNYLSTNPIIMGTALAALILLSALVIHKRYNQPIRRLRRRFS